MPMYHQLYVRWTYYCKKKNRNRLLAQILSRKDKKFREFYYFVAWDMGYRYSMKNFPRDFIIASCKWKSNKIRALRWILKKKPLKCNKLTQIKVSLSDSTRKRHEAILLEWANASHVIACNQSTSTKKNVSLISKERSKFVKPSKTT